MQTVPLSNLVLSPANARQAKTDVADLVASIQSYGLLQPLVVTPTETENVYAVIAGGRRLQALQEIGGDTPVMCVVQPHENLSTEISIVENTHRLAMRPVEEFVAFAKLAENGATSSAIAARFGVTERHVAQRMRLGQLHTSILGALAEEKISLDAAMAYASSEDTALQAKVFKKQSKVSWGAHNLHTIRFELSTARADWKLKSDFAFVGKAAYLKQGGKLEDDLFGDFTRILNPEIVEQLVPVVLKREAKKLAKTLEDNVTLVDSASDERLGDRIYSYLLDEDRQNAGYPAGEPVFAVPIATDKGVDLRFFYPAKPIESDEDENATPATVAPEPEVSGFSKRADFEIDSARVMMLRDRATRVDSDNPEYQIDAYLYVMGQYRDFVAGSESFADFRNATVMKKSWVAGSLLAELIKTKDNYGHNAASFAAEEFGPAVDTNTREQTYWTPTPEFFDLFRKQQLIDMVAGVSAEQAGMLSNMKTADLKARVFKLFTTPDQIPGIDEETRARLLDWVPPFLKFGEV